MASTTPDESETDGYVSNPSRNRAATPGYSLGTNLPSASSTAPSSNDRIRPTLYHNDPSVHHLPVDIPPDNYIPSSDADNHIRLPPPHEWENPILRSPNMPTSPLPTFAEEPIMVPPPVTAASQTPRSVTSRRAKNRRSGRNSSPSSSSTTLSQMDIIQDHPTSGPRRPEWPHHSPMSLIPEVPTPHSSPNQDSELNRRPSVSVSLMV